MINIYGDIGFHRNPRVFHTSGDVVWPATVVKVSQRERHPAWVIVQESPLFGAAQNERSCPKMAPESRYVRQNPGGGRRGQGEVGNPQLRLWTADPPHP